MENNITDSQKEKIQKFLLEIIQKVESATFLEMEESAEMYVNSLKTEVNSNIEKFKKILGKSRLLESDLRAFAATGLESGVASDIIVDIFNENNLILK